jgi:hypothetical protein
MAQKKNIMIVSTRTVDQFTERQKFTQWWIWTLIGVAFLVPVGIVLYQIGYQHSPFVPTDLLYQALPFTVLLVMFYLMRLDTVVDASGVSYQFFPFQVAPKRIEWSDVQQLYVRQYSPIKEFGGWGIRFGFEKGWVYSTRGNVGLQVVKKDGKKVLIGTNKEAELRSYMEQLIKSRVLERKIVVG